jgi:hypothetical protein
MEAVVFIYELLVPNFPGGTESNHERPSEQLAFGPPCGSDASRIQSKGGNDPTVYGAVQRGRY